jgi:hypothetical protein
MKKIANELLIAQKSYDIDKLLSIYHPECLIEYPGMGIKHRGHSSVRAGMALFKSIFRDYEKENKECAQEGNTFVSWGNVKMTLAGNFNGHIPNGKRVSLMNFTVLKFADNLIIYEGHYLDHAGLCLQSGMPLEALVQIKN